MLPAFTAYDKLDNMLTDIVFASQLNAGCIALRPSLSYIDYICLGKYRAPMFLTSKMAVASLVNFILVIQRVGTKPQMYWIRTCSIISAWAIVADKHTNWNFCDEHFVRDTMSRFGNALNTKSSVAPFVAVALPFPTLGIGIDFNFAKKTCSILRGILHSVISSLIATGQAGDCHKQLPGIPIGSTPSIIAQMRGLLQKEVCYS